MAMSGPSELIRWLLALDPCFEPGVTHKKPVVESGLGGVAGSGPAPESARCAHSEQGGGMQQPMQGAANHGRRTSK